MKKLFLHLTIILILVLPTFASAAIYWTADVTIDLKKVTTSLQLAKAISQITTEVSLGTSGEDETGEEESYWCNYRSYISYSNVEADVFKAKVNFEFYGDQECGDGYSGVSVLWKEISSIPDLTLGELVEVRE
ncbi:MAG TPA: hypothetical protein VNJ01_13105 [Bacteriovoracaceae bacterium]|nr:hypothetical protein [Bacteriovoracaceae bacterium]